MVANIDTYEQEPHLVHRAEEQPDPRRWKALGVLLFAAFMDLVDATIVNITVPSIQRDLGASYASIQWVIAGYVLAFAVVLITGGRLGDIFGRKRLFLIGTAGFTLSSLLCGLAPSPEVLVASRVLQGAAAALMVPQVLSIIQVSFSPRERGAAYGMYGAVTGLASTAGPLLGGLLIQANLFGLDWRPVFLINLPIGIAAFVAALVVVRESRSPHALRLDPIGVVLVTAALLLVLYPLVQGRELGWPSWTFAAMAASIPAFILFALYERRKTRVDGSPLVELGLFKQRGFVAGMLVGLIFFAGISSFFLVYTLFLQIGMGFTPFDTALIGLPFSLGVVAASGASIKLAPKFGRKVLFAGTLLLAVGMAGLALTVTLAGGGLTGWHLVPGMLVSGLGMGIVVAPLVDIILAGVPRRDSGSASGVANTTMQIGSALGIAVIGVIFFALLTNHAPVAAASVEPEIRSGLQAAGVPEPVREQIVTGFTTCFTDRMAQKDPFVLPPSCVEAERQASSAQLPAATAAQIEQVMSGATDRAVRSDFGNAMQRSVWFQAGLFVATFVLVFLLPRKLPHHEEEYEPGPVPARAEPVADY
jgi:EmrB/QacA subfamily drug resistance transporter